MYVENNNQTLQLVHEQMHSFLWLLLLFPTFIKSMLNLIIIRVLWPAVICLEFLIAKKSCILILYSASTYETFHATKYTQYTVHVYIITRMTKLKKT